MMVGQLSERAAPTAEEEAAIKACRRTTKR
jgi:hypothetical protein